MKHPSFVHDGFWSRDADKLDDLHPVPQGIINFSLLLRPSSEEQHSVAKKLINYSRLRVVSVCLAITLLILNFGGL